MVAHTSQLVEVPDDLTDEAAVMIEPTACAAHAALRYQGHETVIIGAGTVGLLTLAAITATRDRDRSGPHDRDRSLRGAAAVGQGARRRHRLHSRRAAALGPIDDEVDGARRPAHLGLPQRHRLRRIERVAAAIVASRCSGRRGAAGRHARQRVARTDIAVAPRGRRSAACYAYTRNDFARGHRDRPPFRPRPLGVGHLSTRRLQGRDRPRSLGRAPWRSEGRLRHERKRN